MNSLLLHPMLQHAALLLCVCFALGTVVLSAQVNPHSASWLVAAFMTIGLLLAALRKAGKSLLLRSYALYLFMLAQYLLIVWFLHIEIPGLNPEETKALVISRTALFCLGGIYMPVAHFRFTLHFAGVQSRALRLVELFGWIASTPFAVLCASGRLAEDYLWSGETWVPKMIGAYVFFYLLITLLLTLGIMVPAVMMFFTRSKQRRLQLFYYLLGALPLHLTCWIHFLISSGADVYPAGGLFFIVHVVIIAYAVFRQNVYDITIVIRRGLAYALISLVVGLIYGTLVWSTAAWNIAYFHRNAATGVLFVIAAGLLAAPLLSFLQTIVDRLFFRADIDRQAALERFSREVVSSIQLDHVVRTLAEVIASSLRPRRCDIFLADARQRLLLFGTRQQSFQSANWPRSKMLPAEIAQVLADSGAQQLPLPQQEVAGKGIELREQGNALLVPITHRDVRLGCLLLGPKLADEEYTAEDIRLAQALAAQSSIALANARSYAELEQLQHLTTTVLEALSVGVLVTDPEKIVRFNQAARRMLWPSHGSLVVDTSSFTSLQHPLQTHVRRALADKKELDNQGLHLDGRYVLFSLKLLSPNEEPPLFLMLLHDITDYKELEMKSRRQEGLAQMGQMIASINHEIKNILQPIRHQAANLGAIECADARFARAMAVIPDRITALEKLLNNLNQLSRPIELRTRAVNLATIVESVWLDAKSLPGAERIQFTAGIDESVVCHADSHWLRQVLYNLICNAVQASAACPAPRIELAAACQNSTCTLSVRDNGCGIDATGMKRLFEPFYSTKVGVGTGLGLSISRRIVELHGGTISATSTPEQGTTFVLTLPATGPAVASSASTPLEATG